MNAEPLTSRSLTKDSTIEDAKEQALSFCADQDVQLADEDPTYQVWVFDYDANHRFLGEFLDGEFRTKADAECAAYERAQISMTSLEPEVGYREIEVETVFFFEDFNNPDFAESMNCGSTLVIEISREAEDEE
jgi:hypothetical protein